MIRTVKERNRMHRCRNEFRKQIPQIEFKQPMAHRIQRINRTTIIIITGNFILHWTRTTHEKGKKRWETVIQTRTLWVLQKDENQNTKISEATDNRCYRLNVKKWDFGLNQNKNYINNSRMYSESVCVCVWSIQCHARVKSQFLIVSCYFLLYFSLFISMFMGFFIRKLHHKHL